jgi:ParB family chromosome partitioning protein
MSKKFGLGKGIDSLIKDYKISSNYEILDININEIKESPYQPRKLITEDSIKELVESIRENGLVEPLVVRKKDSYYELVAGHRRLKALQILEKGVAKSYLIEVSNEEAARIALIENIQRKDLNPIELAYSISKIINDFNITHEELAKGLGKSRVFVTNNLRLLTLGEKTINAILEEKITESHGRLLLEIDSIKEREKFLEKVISKNLTVKELEKSIKKIKDSKNKKRVEINKNEIYKQYESKLKNIFKQPVKIKNKKVEIYYSNETELNHVLHILNININTTKL